MNTPNRMPPRIGRSKLLHLDALADEADNLMQDFMDRDYDPDIAFNLTDLTLSRYDEKEAK